MEIRGGEGEGAEGEGRGVRFPLNIFQGYFMDQEACDSELSFLKALVFVRLKKLIFSSSGIKDLFLGVIWLQISGMRNLLNGTLKLVSSSFFSTAKQYRYN